MDERIHRHSWENGRCKLCGTDQPDAPMTAREHRERLSDIHRRLECIDGVVKDRGHTFIILALIILLVRGC